MKAEGKEREKRGGRGGRERRGGHSTAISCSTFSFVREKDLRV